MSRTKSLWWTTAARMRPGRFCESLKARIPSLRPVQNLASHGFGRAVVCGFDHMAGEAVVVMMADESDDCRDVVRYWKKLNEGYDCVFGSRFIRGGGVIDYPKIKLLLNRLANYFLKYFFVSNLTTRRMLLRLIAKRSSKVVSL